MKNPAHLSINISSTIHYPTIYARPIFSMNTHHPRLLSITSDISQASASALPFWTKSLAIKASEDINILHSLFILYVDDKAGFSYFLP